MNRRLRGSEHTQGFKKSIFNQGGRIRTEGMHEAEERARRHKKWQLEGVSFIRIISKIWELLRRKGGGKISERNRSSTLVSLFCDGRVKSLRKRTRERSGEEFCTKGKRRE